MTERQKSAIAVGATMGAAVLAWVLFSYFEARAYENATGKHVSTTDAMFLNLRVQEPAQ